MDLSETISSYDGSPDGIGSPELCAVARYWLSLRGDGPWPARGEIDPLDLDPTVWPNLWLVDCADSAAGDFRFRLAGEAVNRSFGRVVRGCTLEDLFAPEARAPVVNRFRRVAERGEACYCFGTVYVENEGTGWGERLILPLGEDGERVSHLFGVTVTSFRSLGEDDDPRPRVKECFFDAAALAALCGA